jgi:hypothetical protein
MTQKRKPTLACSTVVSWPYHEFLRSRLKSPHMANRFKPMKMHVATFNSNFRCPAVAKTKTRPDSNSMAQQPSRDVPMILM